MIKHGKIRSLIWAFLLMAILIAGIFWMSMVQESGATREYQGAVFARNLSDGAIEGQWIQSSFI